MDSLFKRYCLSDSRCDKDASAWQQRHHGDGVAWLVVGQDFGCALFERYQLVVHCQTADETWRRRGDVGGNRRDVAGWL